MRGPSRTCQSSELLRDGRHSNPKGDYRGRERGHSESGVALDPRDFERRRRERVFGAACIWSKVNQTGASVSPPRAPIILLAHALAGTRMRTANCGVWAFTQFQRITLSSRSRQTMHQVIRSVRSCAALTLACVGLGAAVLLAGCGGGSSGGAATGTATVMLADSPACGYAHVYVTADHVEISSDGNSWTTIPVNSSVPQPIDLVSLNNGTVLPLAAATLSAGTYQQVRLVLKANAGTLYANSVVLSGTTAEIPLTTPSGQQSGYKVLGPFTVQPGTQAGLVLDFNACKSIVVAGNSGQYLLKPVVAGTATVAIGSISGTTMAGSTVYAEQPSSTGGPVIVTGTTADSTGAFALSPIVDSGIGGDVDVVIVPPAPTSGTAGHATYIVQDVQVNAGGTTSIGTLVPAASTINAATVTVTVSGLPGAANLVADQTVTNTVALTTRDYEIPATVTPLSSGLYSVPLAASGPYVKTYSAASFTQDATDAGIYSITATDAAGPSAPQQADVSTGPVSLTFTLAQ